MNRLRDVIAGRAPRRNPVARDEYVTGPKITLYLGRYIHDRLGVDPSVVMEAVREMLREMHAYEGMTVFPAQGIYAHRQSNLTVKEPTMVMTLLGPDSLSYEAAIERAGVLALNLAALYQQESVFAEVTDADGTQRVVLNANCDGDIKCEAIRSKYARYQPLPSASTRREAYKRYST